MTGDGGDDGGGDDATTPVTLPPYILMAKPKIAADHLVRNQVVVVGTLPDGSPATDDIVLSFDRSGAGTYAENVVTLGRLGATTTFSACDLATPGCAGPVTLTAALASAPATVVASIAVEIVDPIEVNPARLCLGGGNVLHIEGDDAIFTGNETITNATFTAEIGPYQNYLGVKVTPSGATDSWHLTLDTRMLSPVMVPEAYENAVLSLVTPPTERDYPALAFSGFGHMCSNASGRFDVVEYDASQSAPVLTAAFEQHCQGAPKKVTGCIHWEGP